MKIPFEGRLARIDTTALMPVGHVGRLTTWPTVAVVCCFWAYLAALLMTAMASRFLGLGGVLKGVVVVVLPLLTLVLNVFIAHSIYRTNDEYLRLRILKCAAVTGVILAFGTTGYFCLEQLGFPHLSMIAVNLSGWTLFVLLMLWVRYRAR